MLKVIFAFISLLCCAIANASEYVINATEGVAYELGKEKVEQVMRAIYAPLNISPQVVYLPSRRELKQVNNGVFDAEAGRIDGMEKQYPNLLKVPIPISSFSLAMYCIKRSACSENSGFLIIQGALFAERYCRQHNLNCNKVMNDVSAFQALQKGHAPALIANDRFATGSLCNSGIQKIYFKPVSKVHYVYHYIHNKHAHLLTKLTESVMHLTQTNVLSEIFQALPDAVNTCDIAIVPLDS